MQMCKPKHVNLKSPIHDSRKYPSLPPCLPALANPKPEGTFYSCSRSPFHH